jgi:hypothetical protein
MLNQFEIYHRSGEISIAKNTNEFDIGLMLEVYKSVTGINDVLYCSAPITSGKRYIQWLKSIGEHFTDIDSAEEHHRESHLKEVIEPNRVYAQRVIQKLRIEKAGRVVIDPTALAVIPGWTQQDWRLFWQRVIEQYVTTAFFVDGWHYSNGCVYEFWVANKKGIPILDENKLPLSLTRGINMIEESITAIQQRGGSTTFIEEVLTQLRELSVIITKSTL